jgi:hypothetical protein
MSTLVLYENDGPRQRGEVVLDDGRRVRVALAADGATIERLAAPASPHALLFHASPDLAAWIAVSFREQGEAAPPILDVFLELVINLGSAQAIAAAFAAVAAAHRDPGPI